MNNKIRRVWSENRAAVNAWLSIPSTVTAELVSRHAFDALTVDLQHGLNDYQTALTMLQAISTSDATPMARVPWLEPGIIMKMLDAGALGIICPMINTRADADTFVRCCQYAPGGQRSFGPTRAAVVHGSDYAKSANENIVTLAMVETEEALSNVADIASTPNLTGIYIGPSDLSLSMGYEPKLDHDEPAVVEAIKHILETAKQAGVKAGIHCLSPDYAKQMMGLGFDLVTLGSDVRIFAAALSRAINEVRS